jgi:hypothetical protein
LSHHKLNILALEAAIIDLLIIVIVIVRLFGFVFSLAMIVVVASMVMASMITGVGIFGGSKLLSGVCLCLRVQVFNLSFTKDTILQLERIRGVRSFHDSHPGIARWRTVDIWLIDDEEDLQTSQP